jgi:hypothetical protein
LAIEPTIVAQVSSSPNIQRYGNQNGKEKIESYQSKETNHFH